MALVARPSRREALHLLASLSGTSALALSAPAAHAQSWRYVLVPPTSLAQVERDVERQFSEIGHLATATLAERIGQGAPIILYDVREEAEFAVSHLNGALRLEPGLTHAAALQTIGARTRGRTAVFYCAVGQRSSRMARQVRNALLSSGALGVDNLRGGVFAWHNESRPLVDADGPTRFVHPFSTAWGRLLTHPDLSAMTPR